MKASEELGTDHVLEELGTDHVFALCLSYPELDLPRGRPVAFDFAAGEGPEIGDEVGAPNRRLIQTRARRRMDIHSGFHSSSFSLSRE